MASASVSLPVVTLARVRSIVLRVSLFTTLSLLVVLVALDAGLHTPHARQGMVSFELAGADAAAILGEWSEEQRRDALLLQGLDYLFLVGYSALFAVVALTLAEGLRESAPRLYKLAPLAARAALLAGSGCCSRSSCTWSACACQQAAHRAAEWFGASYRLAARRQLKPGLPPPSCTTTGGGRADEAYPPRRFAEVARSLGEQVVVSSIWADSSARRSTAS